MTLDEAIKHYQEVAKESRTAALTYARSNAYDTANSCKACAQEHERLAMWLTELMAYRATDTECGHWIPCSERLPEKDVSVLIYAAGHRVTAYFDAVKGVFRLTETDELFYLTSAVTHWMPLPEPPKDGDCE